MSIRLKTSHCGFTLVEMTVSIGLFTIVLFIATSAFLSIVNADRKSRPVRIATDNLNLALEDMTRRIKTGSSYYCSANYVATGGNDCVSGNVSISFTDQVGTRTGYKFGTNADCNNASYFPMINPYGIAGTAKRCILRRDPSVPAMWIPVTSTEINITSLKFFVKGSTAFVGVPPAVEVQPTVLVVIDGIVGNASDPAKNASFKIQSMITQRMYDN